MFHLDSPKAIAQFAAQFASYIDAYGNQIRSDMGDDGFDQSSVKMWLDHFIRVRLHDDSMLSGLVARNDIDTALFSQLLEAVLSKTYDKPHRRLKAREIVPEGPPVHPGAETVATFGFDYTGSASVLASYGEDVNKVEVYGKKSTRNIVGVAAKWAITLQQVRASAMSGIDIDGKSLAAAKYFVDKKIDDLIADGDADLGIDGFLALTTSSVLYENQSGDLTGNWDTSTTVAEIEADIKVCMANYDSDGIFEPTHLIVPTSTFANWRHLRIDSTSQTTMLEYIADKFDLEIIKWKKCDTAAASSATRNVFFAKEDSVVSSIVSQEPEQLPSVWTGLGWETVMHARCGGVRVENPRGILYADDNT